MATPLRLRKASRAPGHAASDAVGASDRAGAVLSGEWSSGCSREVGLSGRGWRREGLSRGGEFQRDDRPSLWRRDRLHQQLSGHVCWRIAAALSSKLQERLTVSVYHGMEQRGAGLGCRPTAAARERRTTVSCAAGANDVSALLNLIERLF